MSTKSRLISGRVPVTSAANVAANRYQYLDLSSAEPNLGTGNTGDVLIYDSTFPGGRKWTAQAEIRGSIGEAAYSEANTASANTLYLSGVDVAQNNRLTAVETNAQAAFNAANTKFSSSGGTITGDTVVTGNLTITGATVYANTENLTVKDNIITLNSNVTGAPSLSAGLEVNRGSSTNTKLLWSEANTAWEFTNDGTTYEKIAGLTYVQAAFNKANSANVLAQAAFDAANTVSPLDSYARTTANAAFARANSGARATASNTAPTGNTVGDLWLSLTDETLYLYSYDGVGNNWVDISGPILISSNILVQYTITANVS